MNRNLVLEIPEAEASKLEALLDEILESIRRIKTDEVEWERKSAERSKEFRQRMDVIWARLKLRLEQTAEPKLLPPGERAE